MNLADFTVKGIGILIVVLSLVEISPIRFDPWKAIASAVGRAINREVLEKVGKLDRDVTGLKEDRERDRAEAYRTHILRFGDEVLHGYPKHSKEHFDQILREIEKYDDYCDEHKEFENGVTKLTSQRIKDVYSKRLEKNDFL